MSSVYAVVHGKDRKSFIAECNENIHEIESTLRKRAEVQYKPLLVTIGATSFVQMTALIMAVDDDA